MGAEVGLAGAERAFENWRLSKKKRGQKTIPDGLWAMAANVARVHGVTKTAERLRLNPTRLKRWCEGEAKSASDGVAFVELAASELPVAGESVVELEGSAGVRLRLVLRGTSVAAVTSVVKELWSAIR